MTYFHGGVAGLTPGDRLVPSPPPVVDDGCPICVARREGRACTVGEYRVWLEQFGDAASRVLAQLEGAPDDAPIDPPSAENAVYITEVHDYARWYAARSQGDLYEVEPVGEITPSEEDPFPSWTVGEAIVLHVIERKVMLQRRDRRALNRAWAKADRMHQRLRPARQAERIMAGMGQ